MTLDSNATALPAAAPRAHSRAPSAKALPDLLCFSHLRWDFVFQRPQHLMRRFAQKQRVYYVEEPVYSDSATESVRLQRRDGALTIVTPVLPRALPASLQDRVLSLLLERWMATEGVRDYGIWYYTPMALAFTGQLTPLFVAYDCMDELSAFDGAPAAMREREQELLTQAGVVFTGGRSLYEARAGTHPNLHLFPSSVDCDHFAAARWLKDEPTEQQDWPGPRLGFFGVLDERLDIALVDAVAALRPDWSLVLVGPVVKIDPATLPRRPNIHYPGMRAYADLPAWLAGWLGCRHPAVRPQCGHPLYQPHQSPRIPRWRAAGGFDPNRRRRGTVRAAAAGALCRQSARICRCLRGGA